MHSEGSLSPPPPHTHGSLLTVRKRCGEFAVILTDLILVAVGVSCRISYSIFSYLDVCCSGSITSVGEERVNLQLFIYL